MRQYRVYTHLTGSGQTPPVVFDRPDVTEETVLVQWHGTGTCHVQGRLDSSMPWTILHTFSAPGFQLLQMCPQMRFEYSVTSGSASVGFYG